MVREADWSREADLSRSLSRRFFSYNGRRQRAISNVCHCDAQNRTAGCKTCIPGKEREGAGTIPGGRLTDGVTLEWTPPSELNRW